MFDDAPVSLQTACINCIVRNLNSLCETVKTAPARNSLCETSEKRLVFRSNGDIFLPSGISERLLEALANQKALDDFLMTLFHPSTTSLSHVRIKDASALSARGLRVLKDHRIHTLEVSGLPIQVNQLMGCLGEWSLQHLRSLNVTRASFRSNWKICVVIGLSKLRSLRTLNVSETELNKHGLEILIEDLPLLENLDISSTLVDDLSPLRKCKDRLKSLNMYNLKVSCVENSAAVLQELEQLRHLDMSGELECQGVFEILGAASRSRMSVPLLKATADKLPNLIFLDVSGTENVDDAVVRDFVITHPRLRFLGLMFLDAARDPMFTDPTHPDYRSDLAVAGFECEQQVLHGLRLYPERSTYVQRSLYNLFRMTQVFREPRVDVIKLVLPGMQKHCDKFVVQMAATACLYNLTKADLASKIHPAILREVVNLSLQAMERYPQQFQLQKNTLLTLCSDRILRDVFFDKYKCARLVLDCLCNFNDSAMNRMSVAICSILAAKISTIETSLLGAQTRYMQKLLSMVQARVEIQTVDITMKFTLSALWNLTDESPATCRVFLEERGLQLFMTMLELFKGEISVETKVLGLINNIAEVPELRERLMVPKFIQVLRHLMHSKHIDVSYFSAGIIAHLASNTDRTAECPELIGVLDDLALVVLEWEAPGNEMVAYRSFMPFFSLLQCHSAYQVQLWAVWAIQHVCTKNAKRYCSMLVEEKGDVLIRELSISSSVNPHVRRISDDILGIVESESCCADVVFRSRASPSSHLES